MPVDPGTHEYTSLAAGAAGGLAGGGLAALRRSAGRRDTTMAVLGGLSFGAFVPSGVMAYYSLPWGVAGFLGFVSGLLVYGLLAAASKISDRIGTNPDIILPPAIRDQFATPQTPPSPKDGAS